MKASLQTAASLLVLTSCCLAFAVYNGAPLIWWDTIHYFNYSAFLSVLPERPTFYAPFFRYITGSVSIWTWQIVHALLLSLSLRLSWKLIFGRSYEIAFETTVLSALILATSLALEGSYLMPDFSAGALVVLTVSLLIGWRDATFATRAFAIGLTTLFLSFHLSHLHIELGIIGAFVLLRLYPFRAKEKGWTGGAIALAVSVLVVATAIAGRNRVVLDTWSPAPRGNMFLFARFYQDPLKSQLPYLCNTSLADPELWGFCQLPFQFNETPVDILWTDARSPMRPGDPNAPQRNAFAGRLLRMAFVSEPLSYTLAFLRNGFGQLFNVNTDELLQRGTVICNEPYHFGLCRKAFRPSDLKTILLSRQSQDQLPFDLLKVWSNTTYAIGLLALYSLLVRLATKPNNRNDVILYILLIFLGLLINAIVVGGLSDNNGRYQLRVSWVPLYGAVTGWLLVRRRSEAPPD